MIVSTVIPGDIVVMLDNSPLDNASGCSPAIALLDGTIHSIPPPVFPFRNEALLIVSEGS